MKNKLFLIFICLILLSVSSVSAGDINQTNIDEVDNSVLSTSNNVIVDTTSASEDTNVLETQDNEIYVNSSVKVNGDGSKDNPFQDLKSALNTLKNSGIIYIAPGNYAGENNTGLSLGSSNKNITITNWTTGDVIFIGNHRTEYGTYNNVFSCYGSTVNINGLTFINCEYTVISSYCDLINISNCNFINNGGLIYRSSSAYTPSSILSFSGKKSIIDNCIFINNLYDRTLYLGGNSTIFNCIFKNNGGFSHIENIGTVYPISKYKAKSIIYVYNNHNKMNINISDCNFENNTCYNILEINNYKTTIFNCNFTDNKNLSGTIIQTYTNSLGNDYNISNCNFINCFANSGGSGISGSAIDMCRYSNSTISNCDFVNCDITSEGGGVTSGAVFIDWYSNSIISDCNFINCSSIAGGGGGTSGAKGITFTGLNSSILNCNFINHTGSTISLSGNYASLYNNSLNGGIISSSIKLISPTYTVVLENKTINSLTGNIILNATNYDDNDNIIVCSNFNFILPNNNVSMRYNEYSDKYGVYKTNVTLNNGENIISAKSSNLVNNTVKTGIVNVKGYDFKINVVDVVKYYGGSERFIVNLTNKNNAPISNVTVKININGVSYNRTTDDKGSCSIGLTLNSGTYEVITEYKNLSVKSNVTIKTTIFSNNVEKIFRNDTQYYATFLDTDGSLLKNTTVQFNINGVMYYRTTNDKGVAKLNINLGQGNYILTAINPISGEQKGNVIKVLPSIVENHDLTKFYRNGSQYVVRLLNADGSLAGAGVNVTFNINGVFYTRTTNTSGYAKLNINLGAGDYIITAEYKGFMTSNKIRVLPVLSAEDLSMSYKDGSKFEAKLFDGQGNAYANQNIKFNINGVFYDRTTDVNGMARLNINLMAGKYIITSMYNGAAISNEITIS